MLQTFVFGIIGLLLTLFGLGFQQFTFFKQKGYKDLHFRWPLPTYGFLTLCGSIVMISSQECLPKITIFRTISGRLKKVRLLIFFGRRLPQYFNDYNVYKDDWPGLKFSSGTKCKF